MALLFNVVVLTLLLDKVVRVQWVALVMTVMAHMITHVTLMTIWMVLTIAHVAIAHWIVVLVVLALLFGRRAEMGLLVKVIGGW